MRYEVHVREATRLVPAEAPAAEVFRETWSRIGIREEEGGWRGAVCLDVDGGLFLKGLYVPPGFKPQHFLRRWHVRNEFRNLEALRGLDVATPEPLAWGWQRRFGVPVRCFLLQREIRDAVDFSAYVAEACDAEERIAVFRAVGEAVHELHRAGFIHGDLACRNLMVRPADRDVIFVDLARVKPARRDRLDWRRRKELYRLVKSADKCGARPEEVDAMLRAAAGEAASGVIDATRELRAIERRGARKWRTWIWRLSGRTPWAAWRAR